MDPAEEVDFLQRLEDAEAEGGAANAAAGERQADQLALRRRVIAVRRPDGPEFLVLDALRNASHGRSLPTG